MSGVFWYTIYSKVRTGAELTYRKLNGFLLNGVNLVAKVTGLGSKLIARGRLLL